jgi:pseudouridine-5'-phosphate glycosidase
MGGAEKWLRIAPEIREALAAGAPLVALETTIVSHGMPYPENVETAWALEREIRGRGATPATIAVLDGAIRVGLSEGQLDALAKGGDVLKLSRNDLAYALATRRRGATTVAATMICAQLAGIRVFATGGIGGVHRGAAQTFDISADLEELAQTESRWCARGPKRCWIFLKRWSIWRRAGCPWWVTARTSFRRFGAGRARLRRHCGWIQRRTLRGCCAPSGSWDCAGAR